MSLLTPEPGLVFWMLISFGIAAFILVKYGFPVIVNMVNQRKEYIDRSLLAAQQANQKLANIKETSEKLLAETRVEQARILEAAAKTQNRIIEESRLRAQTEADKIVEEAHRQIEIEKETALRAVRSEIASLSVNMAEKIIRKELGTGEEQMKVIHRLLDELDVSKS